VAACGNNGKVSAGGGRRSAVTAWHGASGRTGDILWNRVANAALARCTRAAVFRQALRWLVTLWMISDRHFIAWRAEQVTSFIGDIGLPGWLRGRRWRPCCRITRVGA